MHAFAAALDRARPLAPLVLRIGLGVIFAVHGYDKLFNAGISGVEGFFESEGVPLPGIAAPVVAVTEITAGIALLLGVGTRVAALALAAVIVGAIVFVKLPMGLLGGYELDIGLLVGLVALALTGPGALSLDHAIGVEDDARRLAPSAG